MRNAVALGAIRTPMHSPETHEFLSALHPVGHMGDIDDVVDAVLYPGTGRIHHRRDPARRWRSKCRALRRTQRRYSEMSLTSGGPASPPTTPQRVSSVFTEDAIFQGLRPYSVSRPGVFDYYESQPVGLTVDYRIHETRRAADNVVLGYLRADFTRPDGTVIPLNLSVLVTRDDDWRIAHYQVSAVTN